MRARSRPRVRLDAAANTHHRCAEMPAGRRPAEMRGGSRGKTHGAGAASPAVEPMLRLRRAREGGRGQEKDRSDANPQPQHDFRPPGSRALPHQHRTALTGSALFTDAPASVPAIRRDAYLTRWFGIPCVDEGAARLSSAIGIGVRNVYVPVRAPLRGIDDTMHRLIK